MIPLGVDPAEKIARKATENGIPTIAAFFDASKGKEIAETHGPADLIVANNVIANIDDLNSFAIGIKALLHETGSFVFETQYGADVVERLLLDTIYHEHLTYMNIRPIVALCDRHDLKVVNVRRIDSKGGSIRVTVMHKDAAREPEPVVGEMIQGEYHRGHYGQELYDEFQNRIATLQDQFRTLVAEARAAGKKIAGYGVSVGTSVLMPTLGLENEIDIFFDDNPLRGEQFSSPGYDILTHVANELGEFNPGLTVIFAWRYADQIIAKHDRYISDGGLFAIPLPALSTKP